MVAPFNILKGILRELAEIAVKLNDPELNLIMLRLALYEESNPESKDYNPKAIELMENLVKKNKRLKAKVT